jgi:hypothetical protein
MPATAPRQDPRTDKLRLNGAAPHKVRRQAPRASNGVYPTDAEQPETGQPTSGRRPRQYKRVAFAIIEETMAQLGLDTRTELARMLGVADNTVSGWAKKGEVPAWMELACHGLVSLGKPTPEPRQEPDDIVIVRLRADKKDALVSMLDAMGVDYRQI